ncbi:MAG: hypothetical protein FWC43_12105, partial [Planctomycetaceae bacterium]|nr:hypothetical protein [Planctomycetaceae bacterium]
QPLRSRLLQPPPYHILARTLYLTTPYRSTLRQSLAIIQSLSLRIQITTQLSYLLLLTRFPLGVKVGGNIVMADFTAHGGFGKKEWKR